MAYTKHACSHPSLPGVTEEVFYSSNGLQLEFQIDDQHPATTPVAVLEVVVDFLSNRNKLSKEEEQALTLIEDARILLSGKSVTSKTSKKKTTPVAEEVTA